MDESVEYNSSSLFVFEAIGTHWEIETYEPLDAVTKKKVLESIELFDQTYSRFRADSLVAQIACALNGGRFEFPDDCVRVFDLYDLLYDLTDGAIDPLVGQRLAQPGFDKNYTLKSETDIRKLGPYDQQRPCWVKDIERNKQTVVTTRPVVIDIGAAGKGHLIDIISETLFEEQFYEFIIDAGGDVSHSGDWELPVGMEHPHNPEHIVGVINLKQGAICASGSNKEVWGEGLHQAIDSGVDVPAHEVIATWVVANNALTADGLATALLFISADKLEDHFQFSSVRMFADNRIVKSKNFKGELFFD